MLSQFDVIKVLEDQLGAMADGQIVTWTLGPIGSESTEPAQYHWKVELTPGRRWHRVLCIPLTPEEWNLDARTDFATSPSLLKTAWDLFLVGVIERMQREAPSVLVTGRYPLIDTRPNLAGQSDGQTNTSL